MPVDDLCESGSCGTEMLTWEAVSSSQLKLNGESCGTRAGDPSGGDVR